MKKHLHHFFIALLLISSLIFLITYLFIWHNFRIGADDFYFLKNVRDRGIIGATLYEYNNWNSRYFSNLLAFSTLKNYQFGQSLILLALAYLIFSVFSVYLIIISITDHLKIHLLKSTKILFSSVTIAGLFYSCFKINDTWFWICTLNTYLLSSMLFLLGTSFIFSRFQNKASILVPILSFAYIGGSSGPLSLLSLLILVSLFIFKNKLTINYAAPKLIGSIISLLLFFTILYTAPGNRMRESSFQEVSIWWALLYNFKFCGIILIKYLPKYVIQLICFSSIWIVLGIKIKKTDRRTYFRQILYGAIICALLCYLFQLPVTFKTQDVAAYRTLFFVTVLLYSFFAFIWVLTGMLISKPKSYLLSTSLVFFIIIYQSVQFTTQKKIIEEYAVVYDKTIKKLNNQQGAKSVSINDMPASGYLMPMGISKDSAYFMNRHIADFFKIGSLKIME